MAMQECWKDDVDGSGKRREALVCAMWYVVGWCSDGVGFGTDAVAVSLLREPFLHAASLRVV